MNIVVPKGSTYKNGDSNLLADILMQKTNEAKHEVAAIDDMRLRVDAWASDDIRQTAYGRRACEADRKM